MHAGSHTGSARASFCVKTWFLSFHTSLIIKLLATSAIYLDDSVINDSGLYRRVWVGGALTESAHEP
jgi:hypothetical protein